MENIKIYKGTVKTYKSSNNLILNVPKYARELLSLKDGDLIEIEIKRVGKSVKKGKLSNVSKEDIYDENDSRGVKIGMK